MAALIPWIVQAAVSRAADNQHSMCVTEGRGTIPCEWLCACGAFIEWRFTPSLIACLGNPDLPAVDITLCISLLVDRPCSERREH